MDQKTGQLPKNMRDDAAASDRGGWWMILPLLGIGFCCGGPALGAWLASMGILALLGTWWAGSAPWILVGVAAVLGGTGIWAWRRRRMTAAPRRIS